MFICKVLDFSFFSLILSSCYGKLLCLIHEASFNPSSLLTFFVLFSLKLLKLSIVCLYLFLRIKSLVEYVAYKSFFWFFEPCCIVALLLVMYNKCRDMILYLNITLMSKVQVLWVLNCSLPVFIRWTFFLCVLLFGMGNIC